MLRLSPHRLCFDVCTWQGGKKEQLFLDMYNDAMDGMEQRLLKRIQGSNVHMLSDWTGTLNKLKMDHLACFTPAMLALGALHAYVSWSWSCVGSPHLPQWHR